MNERTPESFAQRPESSASGTPPRMPPAMHPATPMLDALMEQREPKRRFNVDETIDESRLEGRGYGALLLYYREAIFDKIHRGVELNAMTSYYFLYTVIFSAIFGAVVGSYCLFFRHIGGNFYTGLFQIIAGMFR